MDVFVARQPIFNNKLEVCAYEILYRVGGTNCYSGSDGDQATSEVIANSFLLIGIEALTGGKRAFINFTRKLLVDQTAALLPTEFVAVEVLEDIEADLEVLTACRKLKRLGYWLVLDDFVFKPEAYPLMALADIIKVDFQNTQLEEKKLPLHMDSKTVSFLAEKIETRAEYELAVRMGYKYFQGYFFSKPTIMTGGDVPGYKLNYLQILQEVNRSDASFEHIESILKRDVSLSYKLLIYINSATYGFRTKISSIKQALVLLGLDEIRKWVSIISLKGLGKDKPDEIMTSSIVRARFGELLAPKVGLKERGCDLFMMGMFSMIDALVDRPIKEIVQELPICDEIKNVLLGLDSEYTPIYQLILSYEKGDWAVFSQLAAIYKLNETVVPKMYFEAICWANEFNSA